MRLTRLIRNPFALIGQGFVLGGLLFAGLQAAHADTRGAPLPASGIAAR